MDIRLVKEKDLIQLATVYKKAFNGSSFAEDWTEKTAFEFVKWLFEKQKDLFFIAIENGKIVGGVAAFAKRWWNGINLSDLEIFVEPSSQKKGVGSALLKRLLEESLRKYNVTYIDGLTTGEISFPLNWYQKLGFKKDNMVHIWAEVKDTLKELS